LTNNIGYDVEHFRSNVEYILVQLFHTIVHERVRNKVFGFNQKIVMPNRKALSRHRAGNNYARSLPQYVQCTITMENKLPFDCVPAPDLKPSNLHRKKKS